MDKHSVHALYTERPPVEVPPSLPWSLTKQMKLIESRMLLFYFYYVVQKDIKLNLMAIKLLWRHGPTVATENTGSLPQDKLV